MQTEIATLASQYPHLAAAFATIPQGEAHLRRLQDLNNTWQNMLLSGATRQYTEVVVTGDQPALPVEDTFDIIYAGGGLNLLNAAVMTQRYGLRVLVFDRFTVGAVHREWNISREELRELLEVGLLTQDELESIIQREYHDGLVRFHSQQIQVSAAELHLKGVLDVAVDAEKLTSLCMRKILAHRRSGLPNIILNNTTFVRCTVQPSSGVTVDVTDASGQKRSFAARLLIDGMGSTSPIACQLNCGWPFSLVCPTVGTVARGYKQGNIPGAIDPEVGEVLVTTEDAHNGRQLIWEAFPGAGDQVAIYLFHYAGVGTSVDLLELFDRFFEQLPSYKDTSVEKPKHQKNSSTPSDRLLVGRILATRLAPGAYACALYTASFMFFQVGTSSASLPTFMKFDVRPPCGYNHLEIYQHFFGEQGKHCAILAPARGAMRPPWSLLSVFSFF